MIAALICPPSPFLMDDKAMPPLGIMYLSSVLKSAGHEVVVFDDINNSRPSGHQCDIYGVSVTTPQYHEALKFLYLIRSENPSAWVVAGGPHATVMPDELLDAGFDQVVCGDGEEAIVSILNGNKSKTVRYSTQKDLSTLLPPDRKCVDLDKYTYRIGDKRCTTIITQRGCPYGKCAFCSQVWEGVRYVPAQLVESELDEIHDLGFDALTVFDDIFFTYKSRDEQIIRHLGALDFTWRALCRSNITIANRDLIALAGQNGCVEIALGIESAHVDVLKAINKGVTLDDHKKAIDIIRGYGIKAKLNCIVGPPGESPESIEALDRFLASIRPDWVDVTCLSVFPGTGIWNNPSKYDLKFSRDYLPFKTVPGQYHCSVSTSKMTSGDILMARDMLEKKYRNDSA